MALVSSKSLSLGKLDIGRHIVALAATLLVAACSGSSDDDGGGTSPPPPPPPPAAPVANAGVDRTVQEMTMVSLSGSATDANGDPITYAWVQTAGTTVTLTGADTPSPSFGLKPPN